MKKIFRPHTYTTIRNYHPQCWVGSGGPVTYQLSDMREGEDLPDFKVRIRDGVNATTSLTAHTESVSCVNGLSRLRRNDLPFDLIEDCNTLLWPDDNISGTELLVVPDSFEKRVIADSRSRMLSKIAKLQTPVQSQIILGELRETIQFLRSPLKTSLELLSAHKFIGPKRFQRQVYKSAAEKAKDIGNSWLELRFALLPLISDIQSILEEVNNKSDKKNFALRSYSTDTYAQPYVIDEYASYDSRRLSILEVDTHCKVEVINHCGVRFLTDPIHGASALWSSTVDFRQLPITAWELTPFSFLVDYFVNVGNLIESSVSNTSAVTYTSESLIRTYVNKLTLTPIMNPRPTTWDHTGSPSTFSYKRRTVKRYSYQVDSIPLVFSLPGSPIRYANLAALATKFL